MVSKLATDDRDRARRLIVLRRLYSGESQTAFAARIGVEVKRWNNVERGFPLSKEVAFQIAKAIPGMTLDWLWFGKTDGLPIKLQRELEDAGKATTAELGLPGARSRS